MPQRLGGLRQDYHEVTEIVGYRREKDLLQLGIPGESSYQHIFFQLLNLGITSSPNHLAVSLLGAGPRIPAIIIYEVEVVERI